METIAVTGLCLAPGRGPRFYTEESRQNPMALTLSSQVTHRTILGVLIGGFALVILLLLAAAYAGVANVQSIRAGAGAMVS